VKENLQLPWKPILNSDHASKTRPGTSVDVTVDANKVESQPKNSKSTADTLLLSSKSEIPSDTVSAAESLETEVQTNSKPSVADPSQQPRIISLCHFQKALKEITPSSSESLGSLAELRKWNEEFGEGRRSRKRKVWGRGQFGFMEDPRSGEKDEGKMVSSTSSRSKTSEMLD